MEIPSSSFLANGTLNISNNLTIDVVHDKQEPELSVVFFVLLILSGITIFTNALILAAFCFEKKLRTYTNYYIFNITIADFVVGLVCMPLRSTVTLYSGWNFGRVPSILFIGFQNSILSVSVCGVIVICIDRYIATVYPIKHFQQKSIRKATIVNIFTWILSFALWIMLSYVWDFVEPNDLLTAAGFSRPNYSLTNISSVSVSMLRLFVPFLLIASFYIRVYLQLSNTRRGKLIAGPKNGPSGQRPVCQLEQRRRSDAQDRGNFKDGSVVFSVLKETITVSSISLYVSGNSERIEGKRGNYPVEARSETGNSTPTSRNGSNMSRKGNHVTRKHGRSVPLPNDENGVYKKPQGRFSKEGRKALRTMTFLVVAFVITWLPNIINMMISAASPNLYNVINSVTRVGDISRWLSYSNSLINPFAYAMAQPLIRQTVLKILCCRKSRKYTH